MKRQDADKSNKQCSNCEYWNNEEELTDPEFKDFGECRKNAPTLIEAFICKNKDLQYEDLRVAVFPYTESIWWCGEFRKEEVDLDTELEAMISNRHKKHAKKIIEILKEYSPNEHKIVLEMKKFGIISPKTYWRDVSFFDPMVPKIMS